MGRKRCKELNRGEDIISKLPDHVLSHILSRLQTQDAVKTCVLSSRWKNLWTLIYNLHFEHLYVQYDGSSGFENFVDKVLCRCQSQEIQDFSISFIFRDDCEILSRIARWICFAIDHKVQNLEINAYHDIEDENWLPIRLPQSILTCNTLVKLKLCSEHCDFVFDILDSIVCFPSLKTLHIELEGNSDSNLMLKFFRSCPVLEELTICVDIEVNENVMTFDITVPTLKTLNICSLPASCLDERSLIHKFVVRAHDLEQLYNDVDTLPSFVMEETPFISDASLFGRSSFLSRNENKANHVMVLLRAIKNTKFLPLSEGVMGVLILAFDGNLPTFPNLIRLKAGIDDYFGWKLLPHFLNNSANLEVLILKKEYVEDFAFRPLDRFSYFEPENVPSCLILNVMEIKMIRMNGGFDELEVMRYLLKNSKVLKRFSVAFTRNMDCKIKMYLQHQISRFLRGSDLCKVEFC